MPFFEAGRHTITIFLYSELHLVIVEGSGQMITSKNLVHLDFIFKDTKYKTFSFCWISSSPKVNLIIGLHMDLSVTLESGSYLQQLGQDGFKLQYSLTNFSSRFQSWTKFQKSLIFLT